MTIEEQCLCDLDYDIYYYSTKTKWILVDSYLKFMIIFWQNKLN